MSGMTITHFRRGFATNCSSCHYILEVEPDQKLPKPIVKEDDSGYDFFIVSDRQSRIDFLRIMFYSVCSGDYSKTELNDIMPREPHDKEDRGEFYPSFDNERYTIPRKIHTRFKDLDFFQRIIQFIMSENIIIFGAAYPEVVEENLKGVYRHLMQGGNFVSRRVSENEWTLMSLSSGTKYSVRFDPDGRQTATQTSPIKEKLSVTMDWLKNDPEELECDLERAKMASAFEMADLSIYTDGRYFLKNDSEEIETAIRRPMTRALEMADVSISNACGRQCPFCYRSSVPDGSFADIKELKKLVVGLKDAGVMELVIGGGEPTEHPNFFRFIESTDFGDLSLTFTTRNFDFLRTLSKTNGVKESQVRKTLYRKVKAIGLSVRTAQDIDEITNGLGKLFHRDRGDLQIVFQIIPEPGWRELLDAIKAKASSDHRWRNVRLLLLGMKFVGRNASADRKAYENELRELLSDERLEYFITTDTAPLGVDTQFIVDVMSVKPDWLKRFSPESWSDVEGERSCFIDLVDSTMSSSSYGGKTVSLEGYDSKSLEKAFEQVGRYMPEKLA